MSEPEEAPISGCCVPDRRIARHFDAKARALADVTEFPPLIAVTSRLLDELSDVSRLRPTVAELGCGTGGLSVELLRLGATCVDGVDLSATSVEVARQRALRAGFAAQASFAVADATDARLEPHDWVVLDRVVCCFGEADRLIASALRIATRRIAISLPESRGWRGLLNVPIWTAERIWDRLHGDCRGYVHDLRRIERLLSDAGFRAVAADHVGLWYVGVYERGS